MDCMLPRSVLPTRTCGQCMVPSLSVCRSTLTWPCGLCFALLHGSFLACIPCSVGRSILRSTSWAAALWSSLSSRICPLHLLCLMLVSCLSLPRPACACLWLVGTSFFCLVVSVVVLRCFSLSLALAPQAFVSLPSIVTHIHEELICTIHQCDVIFSSKPQCIIWQWLRTVFDGTLLILSHHNMHAIHALIHQYVCTRSVRCRLLFRAARMQHHKPNAPIKNMRVHTHV